MGLFSACIWALEWILSLCRSEIAWPAGNHTLLIACPKYRQTEWDIPRPFQIGVSSVLKRSDRRRHLDLPVRSETGTSLARWPTALKLKFCCSLSWLLYQFAGLCLHRLLPFAIPLLFLFILNVKLFTSEDWAMFVTILYACHYLYFLMKCFLSVNPPAYLEKPSTPKKAADTTVQHVCCKGGGRHV